MVAVDAEQSPGALTTAMRSIEAAFLIGVEGATEVLLVRHADCYDGDIASGDDDPALSERGREQAQRLAERLNRLTYDAIYTSPARRAVETARSISPEVRPDERLVEVTTVLDDGQIQVTESPESVLARMRAAVSDIVAAHPGGRVIVVGHGVAILGYLCDVLRLEFGTLRLLPYYTSVNIVRVLGERRMAGSLGDVAHLEGWL
jgi:2,3-bisphosphoglycerate-dependent phosphoglycerate mutase